MKNPILIALLLLVPILIPAQECDTFYLKRVPSKSDTTFYKRIICFDKQVGLHHVKDYYPNGQMQMDAYCSALKVNMEENVGHWIHWNVYPGEELYGWFLQFKKE